MDGQAVIYRFKCDVCGTEAEENWPMSAYETLVKEGVPCTFDFADSECHPGCEGRGRIQIAGKTGFELKGGGWARDLYTKK